MSIDKKRLLENEYLKNFFGIFKREGSIKPDKCNDREKKELEKLRKAHLIKFRKKTNDYVFNKKHIKRLESIPKQILKKQRTNDRKHGRGQCYYLIISNVDNTQLIEFLNQMNFNTKESNKGKTESIKNIDDKHRLHMQWSGKTYSVHFEKYPDHVGYKSKRAKDELMKFKNKLDRKFPKANTKIINKTKKSEEAKKLEIIAEFFKQKIPKNFQSFK